MAHAQIYRGTWEEIALSAHLYRGRTDLTLIVPLDEDAPLPPNDTEKEAARVSSIHAGLGSLTSEVSLVDELHRERQRDKQREEKELS